jgi:hypothetical protein
MSFPFSRKKVKKETIKNEVDEWKRNQAAPA